MGITRRALRGQAGGPGLIDWSFSSEWVDMVTGHERMEPDHRFLQRYLKRWHRAYEPTKEAIC